MYKMRSWLFTEHSGCNLRWYSVAQVFVLQVTSVSYLNFNEGKGKVKVNVYLYSALSWNTSKVLRYSTRSQGISQFYLHTPRSSANGMNLPLPSQPKLVLIYWRRRDGRLSWPWVAGWLHTEINELHQRLQQFSRTTKVKQHGTS